LDFLKLFWWMGNSKGFPTSHHTQDSDTFCKSYDVFFFPFKWGHAVSHRHMATAQNYQILSKFVQRQLALGTLKYHQKLRFWFFSKKIMYIENAPEHVLAIWIFNTTIFCMPFLLSKSGLCMWISAYLLVENNFFLNVPHLLWIWDFVDLYLTHLETRIKCCTIHAYLKKLIFGPSKLCYPHLAQGKKTFFLVNIKCYDLANGKEWVCKIWWTCRHRS
jgi:hypothetical protein